MNSYNFKQWAFIAVFLGIPLGTCGAVVIIAALGELFGIGVSR